MRRHGPGRQHAFLFVLFWRRVRVPEQHVCIQQARTALFVEILLHAGVVRLEYCRVLGYVAEPRMMHVRTHEIQPHFSAPSRSQLRHLE